MHMYWHFHNVCIGSIKLITFCHLHHLSAFLERERVRVCVVSVCVVSICVFVCMCICVQGVIHDFLLGRKY